MTVEIREKLLISGYWGDRGMAADGFEGSSNGDLTYASHSAVADFAGATSPIVRRRHERWPDEELDVLPLSDDGTSNISGWDQARIDMALTVAAWCNPHCPVCRTRAAASVRTGHSHRNRGMSVSGRL